MADLLELKTDRPKEFLVGGATFDLDLVGFETSPDDPNAYRFDRFAFLAARTPW